MHLRNQSLLRYNAQQSFYWHLFYHIWFIQAPNYVTVLHQTFTQLDEKFEDRDFDGEEFLMSEVCIESTLNYTGAAFEEVVIKYFSDKVPRHHSESAVSGLQESKEPPEWLKFLQILLTWRVQLHWQLLLLVFNVITLDVSHSSLWHYQECSKWEHHNWVIGHHQCQLMRGNGVH